MAHSAFSKGRFLCIFRRAVNKPEPATESLCATWVRKTEPARRPCDGPGMDAGPSA